MFDEQRYLNEVLNPLRGKHLAETDLIRQYAVELGADETQLQERLRKVREVWTRRSGGAGRLAEVCQRLRTRDAELRKKHGNDLNSRAWWQAQAAKEAQAAKVEAEQLSDDLRDAFGQLGMVSTAQLERIAKQRGTGLDSLTAAAKRHGIEVVDVTELPTEPGLERTAYETLKAKAAQLGLRSIVPLVHPEAESAPFTLVGDVTVGGARRALDSTAVAAAVAQSAIQANSVTLRTRKDALGLLQAALRNGVDLRLLAIYHLAEPLREESAQGLAAPLLVRSATQAGLTERDAKLLVLSLPSGGDRPTADQAARVRELITSGELRGAEAAFAALPVTDPEHAGLGEMLRARRAELDRLLQDAAEALAAQRENAAEQLLGEAARIAGDDPDVELRLQRLRPPPPLELTATVDEDRVRLVWQPSPTVARRLAYRVVRAEGRPPAHQSDGVTIVETEDPQALDHMPPPAADLHYAVFATGGDDVWSRAAHASARLAPAVTNLHVAWVQAEVEGSWAVNPAVAYVEVHRTSAAQSGGGTPVKASATRFRDADVREGEKYTYRVVAVYRHADGAELRSRPAHATASVTRDRPAYVEGLTATVQADTDTSIVQLRWITAASEQVYIRRSENPPPWPAGTAVTRDEMDHYGTPVAGDRDEVGDETEMHAEVEPGEFVYTPFTARSDRRLTVGAGGRAGVCEPVRQIQAIRFGDKVSVSWIWPDGLGMVEATIARPDQATQQLRLSLAQYQQSGGLIVAVGASGATISVRGLRPGSGGQTLSAAQTVVVDGPKVAVSYRIARIGVFNRQRLLTFTTTAELTGVTLRVVAHSGPAMPANPDQGQILEELGGLRLSPQIPLVRTVTIPKHLRSPVWLCCFLLAPAGARIVNPTPDQMKVM